MSLIDQRFQQLREQSRKAFIPFITAGDPDLAFTRQLIVELDRRGASIIELGIPYSDPIADGPVIQASYTRALDHGVRLSAVFEMTRSLAAEISAPLVTMVSFSIIWRHGLEQYVADARQAGIAGLIVPDLLVQEAATLAEICRAAEMSLIQLVTPTTPEARAVQIAQSTTGFLYFVSVTGITGERQAIPAEVLERIAWLKQRTDVPVCVGFGISQPEHVQLLAPAADGVIVGSALVRKLADVETQGREKVLQQIGDLAGELSQPLADSPTK